MLEAFCHVIDTTNEWVGRTVRWLFPIFTLLVVIDVFTRRVLHNPWFYIEVNVQLMGVIVILGLAYCYLHDGHAGVDILVDRLSTKKRAILDMFLFIFFFGAVSILLWKVVSIAYFSLSILETTEASLRLPTYPLKIIMAVGFLLLLLQGIVKFIRNTRIVFSPKSGDKP